jgi:hypothetical protein
MSKKVYWLSAVNNCELCDTPLVDKMVDGKTRMGPWALMCIPCHKKHGGHLGQGLGQQYEKQQDGRWLKTAG